MLFPNGYLLSAEGSELSVESVAQTAEAIDPILGSLVTLVAFTSVVVVFALFLNIVRKNKHSMH